MSRIQNVSRRGFLQGVLSAGALVLGVDFSPGDETGAPIVNTPADRSGESAARKVWVPRRHYNCRSSRNAAH